MKTVGRRILLVMVASALGLASIRPVFGQSGQFYFKADAGGVWSDDVDLDEFPGLASGLEAELETGVRFGMAGGYHFTDWFAAEVETGYYGQFLDGIRGAPTVSVHDSSLSNVPLLANVVLAWPNRSRLVPYVGAGAGVSFTVFTADAITDGSTFVLDGTESDAVFAYQGFAGLRYQLNEQMDLGLTYRYFTSDGADYDVDDVFTGGSRDIELGRVQTHSISLTFTLRF